MQLTFTIFVLFMLLAILANLHYQAFVRLTIGILITLVSIIILSVTLKACDAEYEAEQRKHAQWQYERENGLPYTSFRGE